MYAKSINLSLDELLDMGNRSDVNWFSPRTMRAWGSRISEASIAAFVDVHTGDRIVFFVSGEKNWSNIGRSYTVRQAWFKWTGSKWHAVVEDIDGFAAYDTLSAAKRACAKYAESFEMADAC